MTTNTFSNIGVIGAGTMGAGITQVCALAGYNTTLFDVSQAVLDQAFSRILAFVAIAIEKQKAPPDALLTLKENLTLCTDLQQTVHAADLVIEAIPEDMGLKTQLFQDLETFCPPHTCFASNTSSFSIAQMAAVTQRPTQVAGMHFFNPVPLMKLVEVIYTDATSPQLMSALFELAQKLGKTPVRAKDTPGFIVNRVARPFYGEALRIVGDGLASIVDVDSAMREVGGFKMGPFELMDLIGIDINWAVTQSVYAAFHQNPRFAPHPIQQQMVEAGHLGRKTGRGFYEYPENGSPPTPILPLQGERSSLSAEEIVQRIYAMLANEAAYAVAEGVATPEDIDTAMKLGTNYPQGPCEWLIKTGTLPVLQTLNTLFETTGNERYRACPQLEIGG